MALTVVDNQTNLKQIHARCLCLKNAIVLFIRHGLFLLYLCVQSL